MHVTQILKHSFYSAFFIACLQITTPASSQSLQLEKHWETAAELKEPESVLYDADQEVLYVSNINNPAGGKDGNGSIGRVSLQGEIEAVEWVVGGMDSPKGLGLSDNMLYVADLTKVVVIDTRKGKVAHTIEVQDAGMLNDITVDAEGVVYVSDSDRQRIYRIAEGKAEVWLEKDFLQKPNGLLAHGRQFYMIDMNAGIFYEVDKQSKALRKIAEGLVGGDGIVAYGKDFLISNWNGEIWHVTAKGKVSSLLDTKADKVNAADIAYIPDENMLLIPTFFANKLLAYKLRGM